MQLREILDRECVVVPLKAQDKDEAIRCLVDRLAEQSKLQKPEAALSAVMERERIRSTGIGKGLAVPHGKCDASDDLVLAVGKLDDPIDFESVDKEPVFLVALLISPTGQTGRHIQALAKICNIVQEDLLRQKARSIAGEQELFDLIVGAEGAAVSS